MDSGRRTFLDHVAGLSAALGSSEVIAAADAGFPKAAYAHSSRTKEFLSAFRLTYPIFQAPAGGSAGPDLASAVCNAGAMGTMASSTTASPEEARERVRRVVSATGGTFAVNYILALAPEPKSLEVVLDAGAPVVHFSWGIPGKQLVAAVRSAGARFGVQVASRDGARAALDGGADYLVCQGIEAGGHVQASTALLDALAAVLAEAGQQPVLAAGGIADGAGIRRVLEAGASGAVLGTRFVATRESDAHPQFKEALLKGEGGDTALSVCFQGGWPNALHRSLRNETFIRWEAAGCPPEGRRPGEGDVLGTRPDGKPLLRYSAISPSKAITGDRISESALYAGLGVGLIKDLPSAGDLVRRLWAECEAAIT
jgi:nitronate monooxygenase